MSQDTQPRFFHPSCPFGGKFYACETGTNFVGCCTRDACTSVGCSAGSLEPASFDKAFYGKFPDQQCPLGSQWFTCAYTDPPFMGCCKSSPCTKGCAAADLTAGFLDSNPEVAAPFLSSSRPSAKSTARSTVSSTSSPPSSPSSTVSSSSATSSSTAEALPENTTASTSRKVSPGAIAGGVVGGVAFVAFLILIAVVFFSRRRKAATSAPVEKDGKLGPSEHYNGVAHPYHLNEIHEAPGVDVTTRDVKDLSQPGSSYPSPTPAYSPGKYGIPQSPPGHPAISELDSPATPFLRHRESHQSFELPSASGRANNSGSPVRSGVSAEGLGINLTSPSHRSLGATATSGHPSPLNLNSASNVPMLERGSRWNYRE